MQFTNEEHLETKINENGISDVVGRRLVRWKITNYYPISSVLQQDVLDFCRKLKLILEREYITY